MRHRFSAAPVPRDTGAGSGFCAAPVPRDTGAGSAFCAAPVPRDTGAGQSQHFQTVSAIDHSKSRSQGNNISLPPITNLTLFYLVLHICSYKYAQPNLFVVFCIESIQNTTKLLCLAFPKKR